MAPTAAPPISAAEFSAAMAQFEPFERRPSLALAVSGGRDSTALALLAHAWASARGGTTLALVVDHGLRVGSAAEAEGVAEGLRGRGIETVVLRWDGPKPTSGVQAAARDARYRLLSEACRVRGALHLLLAHQADDQRETIAERLMAGSGVEGLAGIASVVERSHVRLLRPLLAFPRASLAATATAHAVGWIDDPSNRNLRFARVRWRRASLPRALDELAQHSAAVRMSLETAVSAALVRTVALHPVGAATVDAEGFASLPSELAVRVLGRVLRCVSGAGYSTSRAALDGARARMASTGGVAFTVGGCRVLPRRGRWLLVRETRSVGGAGPEDPWDGRFALAQNVPGGATPRGAGPLDPAQRATWRRLARREPGLAAARPTLPATAEGPLLLKIEAPGGSASAQATFRPRRALAEAAFSSCNAPASPQFSHIQDGKSS